MAESIARYHGHEAYSGGTEPGNSVSGNAIEALVEGGYSPEGLIPKSIDLVYPGAVSYTHLTLPTTPYV